MTTKEAILSKLIITDDKVIPKRSEEALKKAAHDQSVLNQEFKENTDLEYHARDLSDFADRTVEEEGADKIDQDLFRHTDCYLIGGRLCPVVVAKTTMEVLNMLKEARYTMIKTRVNFSRVNSENLETRVRNFYMPPIPLPRARKGQNVQDGMVIVEPSVNGFQMTILLEDLDDKSYSELMEDIDWIANYQGYLLEKTIQGVHDMGMPDEDIIKSQTSVGLVSKVRNLLQSRLMRMEGSEVITENIRSKAGEMATEINEEMQFMPLTGMALEMGTSISCITVTTDPAVVRSWKSESGRFSYFEKGASHGRIERLSNNCRRFPILSDDAEEISRQVGEFLPSLIIDMENASRRQLGITTLVPRVKLPPRKSPKTKDFVDLLGLDRNEVVNQTAAIRKEIMEKADARLNADSIAGAQSLLARFLSNK